jgi:hypothetical protein
MAAIDHLVRNLFGRFQNLNLLMLRENLRANRTARRDWADEGLLCPLGHGLHDGDAVHRAEYANRTNGLDISCWYAATQLGASYWDVQRFIDHWDHGSITRDWLTNQLDLLWRERLDDADAVQWLIAPLRYEVVRL